MFTETKDRRCLTWPKQWFSALSIHQNSWRVCWDACHRAHLQPQLLQWAVGGPIWALWNPIYSISMLLSWLLCAFASNGLHLRFFRRLSLCYWNCFKEPEPGLGGHRSMKAQFPGLKLGQTQRGDHLQRPPLPLTGSGWGWVFTWDHALRVSPLSSIWFLSPFEGPPGSPFLKKKKWLSYESSSQGLLLGDQPQAAPF